MKSSLTMLKVYQCRDMRIEEVCFVFWVWVDIQAEISWMCV